MGNSRSINGFRARSKDYPLHKVMVDHNHNTIKPRGDREIGDEVDRKLFERERDGG